MNSAKLTTKLAALLEGSDPSETLEIVLELNLPFHFTEHWEFLSRNERIALEKAAFNRAIGPIKEAVREVGGDVTGQVWINQTLRARVPVKSVAKLSELEGITSLDTPNRLELETR